LLDDKLAGGSSTLQNQTRYHNKANEIDTDDDHSNTPGNAIVTNSGWPTWFSSPAYDAAGNMTKIPQPAYNQNSAFDLKYDAWNRLVEVKSGMTVVQTNQYDGLGRRIVRDETGGSGVLRHYYYNENWQVVEERTGTSTTANRQYVWHPHYIDALAQSTGGGTHWYIHDANFNVTAALDSNGGVEERYSYTPYGEVKYLNDDFSLKSTQASSIGNTILFTGRERDPENGLQLNRRRFYSSWLGRWITRDPIGYRGDDANLCAYVKARPIIAFDPSGLQHWWEGPDFPGDPPKWPIRRPEPAPAPPKNPGPVNPLPSNSPECDKYPCDDRYAGANSRCFCKCAGDSPWSNYVRGCLRKLKEQQPPVSNHEAHKICYNAADGMGFPGGRPWTLLLYCWLHCSGSLDDLRNMEQYPIVIH
jgi:RHS repeat-associated protein